MDNNLKEIFDLHKKGKIEVAPTVEVKDASTLAKIYTPGVAKVCEEIAKDKTKAYDYTIKGRTVAVVTDGSAVLGLGDIGPYAGLPVMEGKAMLFKEFGEIDAFPICLNESDPDKIVEIVKAIEPVFGAINLEDIKAPGCFEIERRLNEELNIPVMHDDQHATAIVTLAALMGSLELINHKDLKIVLVGAGAAGSAVAKLLANEAIRRELSIKEILVHDSQGLISTDRTDLDKYKKELAEISNQPKTQSFEKSLDGAHVFIGLSKAGLLNSESIKKMSPNPIIFAMANPVPEILPDEAKKAGVGIIGTGRSDFPNQINNALAFPGVFKGLIEGKINKVTDEIKIKAARAIFEYHKDKLEKKNILPSILDKAVPGKIAEALLK